MAQPLNITRVQFYIFLTTMFVSIGMYIGALEHWSDAAAPAFIGAVLVAIAKDVANFLMGRSRSVAERQAKLDDLQKEIPSDK